MKESIFTKIINGDMPCHKVYEDELTFALMDIHPIQPGQVLVIPKKQIDHVWDLPEEDYNAVMETARKVSRKLVAAFPGKRIGLQIEGLDVAHAHLKLFPFSTDEEFNNKPDLNAQPNHEELADTASKLAF